MDTHSMLDIAPAKSRRSGPVDGLDGLDVDQVIKDHGDPAPKLREVGTRQGDRGRTYARKQEKNKLMWISLNTYPYTFKYVQIHSCP